MYSPTPSKVTDRSEFIFKIQKKFENDQRVSLAQFFDEMKEIDEPELDNNESAVSSSDDEDSDTNFCVLCRINSRTTMLEPCNELKYCYTCVKDLSICPTCGVTISGRKIVFL